ncbi:glutamate--cysteine ligase [Shewanella sp. OPT22]|nr:glutamate--cysteine ligase [Shewanella sp. OPT22]
MKTFSQLVASLANEQGREALKGMKRGIEREALRIDSNGHLAKDPHPKALGSALTHSRITTDYSESLLEFITPVFESIPELFDELNKTHAYTVQNINGQYLWPVSMPCFVDDINNIPVADYGSSNIGKLKKLYRTGLTHRYGAQMQIISGLHFNFSVSDKLWQRLYEQSDKSSSLKDFISESYFGLIRNYRRVMWVLPYLFGASPALCGSFLSGNENKYPFKKTGKGTLYLPHATSLRMSDLGYTNKEQSSLGISYNSLSEYLEGMKKAIRMPSANFADIGVKVGEDYRQLNDRVLQIENEFYSPIRAKRVSLLDEKPSEALARGGVEYIEVRALDINPFSAVGITEDQVRFLDLFLLHCLLSPSDSLSDDGDAELEENLNAVIISGRKSDLLLKRNGNEITLEAWLLEMLEECESIAEILDGSGSKEYKHSLDLWREAATQPSKTLSGQILNHFVDENADQSKWAFALAKEYNVYFSGYELSDDVKAAYELETESSLKAQSEIEFRGNQDFDEFLKDYFSYLG